MWKVNHCLEIRFKEKPEELFSGKQGANGCVYLFILPDRKEHYFARCTLTDKNGYHISNKGYLL